MRNKQELSLTPAAIGALAKGDMENFLVAATPGGIEAQEARGQVALVDSDTLPRRINWGTREEFEAVGVKFGDDVDDLFCRVELPAGWRKIPTDHSMWSKLVDGRGRPRASIFYKAAFYDRAAHMSLTPRYDITAYAPCDEQGHPVEDSAATHYLTAVRDAEVPIRVVGIRSQDDHKTQDEHYRLAEAWLNEHYPEWKSRTAYWRE